MDTYPTFHRDRVNLLLHIVMVPVFDAGVVAAALGAVNGRWAWAAAFAVVPVVSLAVQGAGHRREGVPPIPFVGPGNFVGRIFAEQFYKFPAFVLSGGWLAAFESARPRASRDPG